MFTRPCQIRSPCEVGECIVRLQGLRSNSASPTDTMIASMQRFSFFGNEKVKKNVFLKIFISPNVLPDVHHPSNWDLYLNRTINDRLGLRYEGEIYEHIKRNLIETNICPYFVNRLMYGRNCTYEQMLNNLLQSLPVGEDRELQFKRSNVYMITKAVNRPAITSALTDDEKNYFRQPQFNEFRRFSYDFILSEMSTGETLEGYINRVDPGKNNLHTVLPVVFQTLFACRSMFLTGVTHNDLHMGNVFIQKLPYNVNINLQFDNGRNNESHNILTSEIPLIYDFDYAYCRQFGDNPKTANNNYGSPHNLIVEIRDMIKILIMLARIYQRVPNAQQMILGWFTNLPLRNPIERTLLETLMREPYPPTSYILSLNNPNIRSMFKNSYEILSSVAQYMNRARLFNTQNPDASFILSVDNFDNMGNALVSNRKSKTFLSAINRETFDRFAYVLQRPEDEVKDMMEIEEESKEDMMEIEEEEESKSPPQLVAPEEKRIQVYIDEQKEKERLHSEMYRFQLKNIGLSRHRVNPNLRKAQEIQRQQQRDVAELQRKAQQAWRLATDLEQKQTDQDLSEQDIYKRKLKSRRMVGRK